MSDGQSREPKESSPARGSEASQVSRVGFMTGSVRGCLQNWPPTVYGWRNSTAIRSLTDQCVAGSV